MRPGQGGPETGCPVCRLPLPAALMLQRGPATMRITQSRRGWIPGGACVGPASHVTLMSADGSNIENLESANANERHPDQIDPETTPA